MKHAPTFADTVLRESFRSKNEHVPAICRYALAQARRFVLDANASTFLSDLSHANFSGTSARAVRAMEASRVLARAPHAITWVEYLPREERRRTIEAYPGFAPANKDKTLTPPDEVCEHTGWLIRQHPNDENLFRLVLFDSQSAIPAVMMPYDIIWRTDNQPVRFTKLPRPDDLTDEEQYAVMARIATGIPYKTKSIGFTTNDRTAAFSPETVQSLALEMAGELRKVLTLLACINDIPIGVRHVTQTHGFVIVSDKPERGVAALMLMYPDALPFMPPVAPPVAAHLMRTLARSSNRGARDLLRVAALRQVKMDYRVIEKLAIQGRARCGSTASITSSSTMTRSVRIELLVPYRARSCSTATGTLHFR